MMLASTLVPFVLGWRTVGRVLARTARDVRNSLRRRVDDGRAPNPASTVLLGGITVPHSHGLLGHSDADALLHAITDALFGAAALGDIGRHFPDTDAAFKGADSGLLLAECARRVRAQGWVISNIDATIIAQAPKLAPHIEAMRSRIAQALGLAPAQVNVKAKTAEKLGPVGQGLSIEARAVVLLQAQVDFPLQMPAIALNVLVLVALCWAGATAAPHPLPA